MISIITDAESKTAISTNALLNIAHRLLNEYRDCPEFTTVELVRYGAGFNSGTLMVRLTRLPDGKVSETWGRQATAETSGTQPQPGSLVYTTKAS